MLQLARSAILLALVRVALGQTLAEDLAKALKDSNDTTLFQGLLSTAPQLLTEVVGDKTSGITVLVPDDDALTTFMTNNNVTSIDGIDMQGISTIFKYHVLVTSDVSKDDFTSQLGLIVPTLLQDEKFNLRSPGPAITSKYGNDAIGQVLYFSKDAIPAIAKRQDSGGNGALASTVVNVRAGLETQAKVTIVDGTFGTNNKYQLVNDVLVPPQPCSTTIQNPEQAQSSSKLKALDDALKKTELYPALDTSPNVTCLAPSSDAFKVAGNPQDSLNKTELTGALLFHTLAEVTYTTYLRNGQKIATLSNDTITVTIDGNDIYFNNAKVVEPNVLTNNGLIHILDQIMTPDGKPSSSSDSEPSGTASGDQPEETDKEDAAPALRVGASAFIALAAGLALL